MCSLSCWRLRRPRTMLQWALDGGGGWWWTLNAHSTFSSEEVSPRVFSLNGVFARAQYGRRIFVNRNRNFHCFAVRSTKRYFFVRFAQYPNAAGDTFVFGGFSFIFLSSTYLRTANSKNIIYIFHSSVRSHAWTMTLSWEDNKRIAFGIERIQTNRQKGETPDEPSKRWEEKKKNLKKYAKENGKFLIQMDCCWVVDG